MAMIPRKLAAPGSLPDVVVAALLAIAVPAIFVFAPTEETMGDAQRILYVHVSMAWLSLAGFLIATGAGLLYLVRRNVAWDDWAQAAAELGWLSCTLTLVTGSLWARAAWNTWWTWDPRLTATFVLWAIYSGYLIVRSGVEDAHRRARVGAILTLVGALDLPLVALATRWFRGVHPVAPRMEPSMRAALLIGVVAFSGLFALLLVRRRAQLSLRSLLLSLDRQPEM